MFQLVVLYFFYNRLLFGRFQLRLQPAIFSMLTTSLKNIYKQNRNLEDSLIIPQHVTRKIKFGLSKIQLDSRFYINNVQVLKVN